MAFGGTNWGQSAAPVVYTSYDYSAPLRETRQIRDKLSQTKLIGLFTRVSKDLQKTDMEGNGTSYTSYPSIFAWVLRNPDTKAGFYTLQQATSNSRASTTFDLNVNTSAGPLVLPNINLNGRQSKIVVTDYAFGNHSLLYSTADILTYGTFGTDVMVLYLQSGQTGQFAFTNSNESYKTYGSPLNITSTSTNRTATFTYVQGSGASVVQFSNGALFYLLDQATAWKFWAVPTTSNPNVSPSDQIFVTGPYLVRSATTSGSTVQVTGDNANATVIEVYAGKGFDTLTWNGQDFDTTQTPYGSLIAHLPGTDSSSIVLPSLTDWKVADSLPEASPNYDDSAWAICNKTTTLSPTAPITLPVLFASDYGFYTGVKVYRGRFDAPANSSITGANITAQNGVAAGMSAWLNGALVGSVPGNASIDLMSLVISFSNFTTPLKPADNVLTVLVDYTGHDETSTRNGVENPRGLLGASLLTSSSSNISSTTTGFTSWRIQGPAGGNANLDPIRGPLNEGGLYGERLGWHLPGFDTSSWNTTTTSLTLPSSGVSFFITTFPLSIPSNLDVPLGIRLSSPPNTTARVQLFVNGYQYGKFVPHIGPQTAFPVPPGIINNGGENTLALSVWAMTDEGATVETVELFAYGAYESGFEGGFARSEWKETLQPGWAEGRERYA